MLQDWDWLSRIVVLGLSLRHVSVVKLEIVRDARQDIAKERVWVRMCFAKNVFLTFD